MLQILLHIYLKYTYAVSIINNGNISIRTLFFEKDFENELMTCRSSKFSKIIEISLLNIFVLFC